MASTRLRNRLALPGSVLTLCIGTCALGAEPYVSTGFPYALVGVSQSINRYLGVRADFGTLGKHNYNFSTSGDDFKGDVSYKRSALVGDWFVSGGGFRVTGGATFNQAKATMRASSQNNEITLNGVSYNAPSSLYYVQSNLSFPKVTPYLGLGWGHHGEASPGFSFNVDLGVSIGTAKATALTPSPALQTELALSPSGASDLSNQNADFQSNVDKIKAIPQLTFGLGYRF